MSEHQKQLDVAIGKAVTDCREAVGMTQRWLGKARGRGSVVSTRCIALRKNKEESPAHQPKPAHEANEG